MGTDVKLFGDLDAAAADAAGALDRARRPSMFDRLEWYRLVHAHTPSEGELLVVRATHAGERAWLFLTRRRAGAQALSNWYSLRTGPVIEGGGAAVAKLPTALRQAGVGALSLSPIAADDPLPATLRQHGWMVARSQSSVSWRIRIAGMTFEDYWAGRPSRLRNTAKRRAKTAGLTTVIHDRFDEGAWADYEAVYEASWKPPEGSPAMMRELAQREGEAGTLRLGLAYLNGRAVAAQLWTVEHGLAIIHKLAYAEDAKQISPGTVLSVALFRRVIDEDRVEMIDFGLGDDPYKTEWMAECEPLYALQAFDLMRPRGWLAAARHAAAKLVRRARSQ